MIKGVLAQRTNTILPFFIYRSYSQLEFSNLLIRAVINLHFKTTAYINLQGLHVLMIKKFNYLLLFSTPVFNPLTSHDFYFLKYVILKKPKTKQLKTRCKNKRQKEKNPKPSDDNLLQKQNAEKSYQ